MTHLNKGLQQQYGTDWENVKDDLMDDFDELLLSEDMEFDDIDNLFGMHGLDLDAIEDLIYEIY